MQLRASEAPGGPDLGELAERHRSEIRLHCYRMLGSINDADDATQEALLRAWRGRAGFDGRAPYRAWLYKIATNVCLRMLERRAVARRVTPEVRERPAAFQPLGAPAVDIAWLEPFPVSAQDLLSELALDPAPGPEARYAAHESVRLAFVALIQELPPRQRAALLLRDVLAYSAQETAAILGVSVHAANSALQRARAAMRLREADCRTPQPIGSQDRELLERYVRTWEAADVAGFVRLLTEDARWTMPPWEQWYAGREAIRSFLEWAWRHGPGHGRLIPTWANGEPAFGYYRRASTAERWEPFAIVVPELRNRTVASIANFVDARLFPVFGLSAEPTSLPGRVDDFGAPRGS